MQSSSGTLHRSKNKFSSPAYSPSSRVSGSLASQNSTGAELILIRGLPGSGKSTMAKVLALVGFEHFEADMFFEVKGVYQYDASRIRDAHAWCQRMARQALEAGKRVVVSNTFTRLQEMAPYRSMTENIRVVEATGRWDNLHGVPAEMMQRMAKRWEALPCSRPIIDSAL